MSALYGDWRRRTGSKTPVHLYPRRYPLLGPRLPACGRRIPRQVTSRATTGQPCYECLAAAASGRIA